MKRYRFTGKEREEETGLNYHGARYYASWLARWICTDPIFNNWYKLIHNQNERATERSNDSQDYIEFTAASYEYSYANPIRFIDPTGEQPYAPLASEFDFTTLAFVFMLPVAVVVADKKRACKTLLIYR